MFNFFYAFLVSVRQGPLRGQREWGISFTHPVTPSGTPGERWNKTLDRPHSYSKLRVFLQMYAFYRRVSTFERRE